MDRSRKKRSLIMAIVMAAALVAVVAIVTAVVLVNDNSADAAPIGLGRGFNKKEYMAARDRLLAKDQGRALGAGLVLNTKEQKIDAVLLKEKKSIMERSRLEKLDYNPALSFFKTKLWMENTTTFKIIQKMPKGAALHTHEPAIASLSWLVKNVTYRDYVYMCTDSDGFILLNAFPLQAPENPDCPWKSVQAERKKTQSVENFDERLRKSISLLTTDPLVQYPSVDKVWKRFDKYFEQVIPLLFYTPIFRDYYKQALQEFYDDNVQFVEVRGQLFGYRDKDGVEQDSAYGTQMYYDVTNEFMEEHTDFGGAATIMAGLRFKNVETIAGEVRQAMKLLKMFPGFFLGYDLVGQEGPYNSLLFYMDALLEPTIHSLENAVPYFFHAAETKWQGTDVDENLIDAILLNTTRVGHGYAFAKHPELVEIAKKRGIAVEVNPISNQLLGLVTDLRNHAMVPLLADDFPIVVSSDDPATWEALPMTHDFMVAFMDMSGQDMGLSFLKQLAINSIKYSAVEQGKREAIMKLWQSKWDTFVDEIIKDLNL